MEAIKLRHEVLGRVSTLILSLAPALLLLIGCVQALRPAATPEKPGGGLEDVAQDYLDNRSTPNAVVGSYYNAINRKEYVRAYSYWNSGEQAPPYKQFQLGHANTASVQLTFGTIGADVDVDHLYYTVPALLKTKTAGGASQVFVGCYSLQQSRPELQAAPPFRSLGIASATMEALPLGADPNALLSVACQKTGIRETTPLIPTAIPPGNDIAAAYFRDDRSGSVELLTSLFNGINRKEYARAYSYWDSQSKALRPFPKFRADYASIRSLELARVKAEAVSDGAYHRASAMLKAVSESGGDIMYAGCYTMHLTPPRLQETPPFQPLSVRSELIREVDGAAEGERLLARSCQDIER